MIAGAGLGGLSLAQALHGYGIAVRLSSGTSSTGRSTSPMGTCNCNVDRAALREILLDGALLSRQIKKIADGSATIGQRSPRTRMR